MKVNKLKDKLPCDAGDLHEIWDELLKIRKEIIKTEAEYDFRQHDILPEHMASAKNLIHYLALRRFDIRELQLGLTNWGISSLGRVERKVQANIDTLMHIISSILNENWKPRELPPICFNEARNKLEENSNLLLGKIPENRRARIMVTMPTEAAYEFDVVHDLMKSGMNVARINCAHDDTDVWSRIINNIHKAEKLLGVKCVIHMDLGGPKLRTGKIEGRPAVVKVKPVKNEWGRVEDPVKVWFYFNEKGMANHGALTIPLISLISENLKKGDELKMTDARKSNRTILISEVEPHGFWGLLPKTTYFCQDLEFKLKNSSEIVAKVDILPESEGYIVLEDGDLIKIYKSDILGMGSVKDISGKVIEVAKIGCTLPEALDEAKPGERIWFDDGIIEGEIMEVKSDHVLVSIKEAKNASAKIRSEKGINLPDTNLKFLALTEKDIEDLDFVVGNAETIGLSFANRPKDVRLLINEINKRTAHPPGVILKIETARGFYNLPRMILEAMCLPSLGVMIARGDLAIECGFGRLAEVQEQILWISEAAHVPVIWATQVLESLAKTGLQTRAEVSDAAMGQRAECIMLNKGEHIVKATKALDEILHRMQDHQTKKRSKHRKLTLAEDFFKEDNMMHV